MTHSQREPGFLLIDNEFVDRVWTQYELDVAAVATYVFVARSETRGNYPTVGLVAAKLGIDIAAAERAVRQLYAAGVFNATDCYAMGVKPDSFDL
jgi:hypothetical protein